MSNLREAAQQALEALEWHLDWGTWGADLDGCAAALRAALEQDEKPVAKIRTWHKGGEQNAELWDWDDGIETLPDGEHLLYASAPLPSALEQQAEPEPVAWMCPEDPERETAFSWKAGHCENCGKQRIPLYTAPPQRKPLTDEEEE